LSRYVQQDKYFKNEKIIRRIYIRKLRVDNELTLIQLAAYIGIDSGDLSMIENGKKKLDEKVLPQIAEKFNRDLEILKI
jgi:transcriptional regulator with XRE-family HTH domain